MRTGEWGEERDRKTRWVSERRTMVTAVFAGFCHWIGTQQERRFHIYTDIYAYSGELRDFLLSTPKGKDCCHLTFHLSAVISCGQITHMSSCGLFESGSHTPVLLGTLWCSVAHMCFVGRADLVVVWHCGATNGLQICMNMCGYSKFNDAFASIKWWKGIKYNIGICLDAISQIISSQGSVAGLVDFDVLSPVV